MTLASAMLIAIAACSSTTDLSLDESRTHQLVGLEMKKLGQLVTGVRMAGPIEFNGLLPSSFVFGSVCGVRSNTDDTDGNGVPNDLTLSFRLPACRTSSGILETDLLGAVRFQDLGGRWGVRLTYNSLWQVKRTLSGPNEFTVAHLATGGMELRYLSDSAIEIHDFVVRVDSIVGATGQAITERRFNIRSTYRGAVTVHPFGLLQPVQRINVDGWFTLVRRTATTVDSSRFDLATTVPLEHTQFEFCRSPFSSGTLKVRATGKLKATVDVKFTCGF